VTEHLPELAVAIIEVGGRFALQHRDDLPDISWGGYWGLFGGAVEAGETPLMGVTRELEEEITLTVTDLRLLWRNDEHRDWKGRRRTIFVFHADLTELWPRHEVREGQGSGLFEPGTWPEPFVPTARAIIERYLRERADGLS